MEENTLLNYRTTDILVEEEDQYLLYCVDMEYKEGRLPFPELKDFYSIKTQYEIIGTMSHPRDVEMEIYIIKQKMPYKEQAKILKKFERNIGEIQIGKKIYLGPPILKQIPPNIIGSVHGYFGFYTDVERTDWVHDTRVFYMLPRLKPIVNSWNTP